MRRALGILIAGAHVTRILIHEPNENLDECCSSLQREGAEVVVCRNREGLVGALGDRRPDVLVYVIEDLARDLELLAVLRRIAPTLPIILLGRSSELGSRRSIQELKPTYYGVLPLEASELSDAVHGALRRRAGNA